MFVAQNRAAPSALFLVATCSGVNLGVYRQVKLSFNQRSPSKKSFVPSKMVNQAMGRPPGERRVATPLPDSYQMRVLKCAEMLERVPGRGTITKDDILVRIFHV